MLDVSKKIMIRMVFQSTLNLPFGQIFFCILGGVKIDSVKYILCFLEDRTSKKEIGKRWHLLSKNKQNRESLSMKEHMNLLNISQLIEKDCSSGHMNFL